MPNNHGHQTGSESHPNRPWTSQLDELWGHAAEAIAKHTGNFGVIVSDMSLAVQERSLILREHVKVHGARVYESAREHGGNAYDFGAGYIGPQMCSWKSQAKDALSEHVAPKVKMCFDKVHEQAVIHLGDERVTTFYKTYDNARAQSLGVVYTVGNLTDDTVAKFGEHLGEEKSEMIKGYWTSAFGATMPSTVLLYTLAAIFSYFMLRAVCYVCCCCPKRKNHHIGNGKHHGKKNGGQHKGAKEADAKKKGQEGTQRKFKKKA